MPVKKKKKTTTPKKKKAIKKPVKRVVKKIIKKKPVKKAKKKVLKVKKTKLNIIGKITHYFPKVRAAVIKLKVPLAVGDYIKVKGHTTDFTQKVDSLQIDRVPVNAAKKGAEIGLLVNSRVRQGDIVCKP